MARRRLKLSQDALAGQVSISRNYISMIERGVADPSYGIVVTLCAYLEIEPPPDHPRAGTNDSHKDSHPPKTPKRKR